MTNASSILVVIPTLNEAAHIEDCVHALLRDPAARRARVLVVDGGSTEATRAIVAKLHCEFPNVSLRPNPRRLQAAAMNLAASDASEEVLIRCDAHASYPENFLTLLADALACTGAHSVVVPMDAVGQGCFQRAVAWIVDSPLGSGGAAHRGGAITGFIDHGHHAAFAMAKFKEIGGYDESFSHNEDAEFDRRLTVAGGRIWIDENIRIGYFPRASFTALWRQYWNYGRGRARMLIKHRLAPKPRQMIPVVNLTLVILSLLFAIVPAFGGLRLLGFVWPAAYLMLLSGASLAIALWKRSLCGLGAGPALFAIHNAWALGFMKCAVGALAKAKPA